MAAAFHKIEVSESFDALPLLCLFFKINKSLWTRDDDSHLPGGEGGRKRHSRRA